MGSFSEDGEEYRFLDAQCDITRSRSDSPSNYSESSSRDDDYGLSISPQYNVWVKGTLCVQERRSEFLRLMGISLDGKASGANLVDGIGESFRGEFSRINESSGAVLRKSSFEIEFSSSRSSMTSWSNDDFELTRGLSSMENFECRTSNANDSLEHDADETVQQPVAKIEVEGNDQLLKFVNDEPSLSISLVQQQAQKEIEVVGQIAKTMSKVKNRWLTRLRSFSCILNREGTADSLRPIGRSSIVRERIQRVNVRHCKRRLKELSALFVGQAIHAHDGSILTMKFSPDGQYLASAGEDGIVRVWQVVEDDRLNDIDIPDIDPSCLYFTVNHLSELAPLMTEQEKLNRLKSLRKTADSACVIFPPVVFRILEKPLHEFRGHKGEVLDLSWSKDKHLISASVDETVRLWKVGCDQCLKTFPHSNYVTCVQFNPIDDNYFISGSIDGKVRIWAIDCGQVVDWTDVRDLVTAVSYCPDGQGGIIGYVTGNCRFFSITDQHFQLEAEMCLNSKKKPPNCKRITGFQFVEQDSSKVMVTSADSQVRILHGINIVSKFRGQKTAANQIFASFTPDGRHIISACDDSNVYLWNCDNQGRSSASQPRTSKSFECFSTDASVAIPWPGLKQGSSKNGCNLKVVNNCLSNTVPFSPSACFSMGQGLFIESIPKGSATWPEEKLPSSPRSLPSSLCKSQYKFLKASCQSSSKTHAWGLVIVTAGWDGKIRSFHNYGLPVNL